MWQAVFSIGSNLGNRREHLAYALDQLSAYGTWLGVSPVYESEPVGFESSNRFYNICAVLQVNQQDIDWKNVLLGIEEKVGRARSGIYADRQLDIDLLFFDPEYSLPSALELPHPRMAQRAFVILPLYDIRTLLKSKEWRLHIEEWKKQCVETQLINVGPL